MPMKVKYNDDDEPILCDCGGEIRRETRYTGPVVVASKWVEERWDTYDTDYGDEASDEFTCVKCKKTHSVREE